MLVLVIGNRRNLEKALCARKIPFIVWNKEESLFGKKAIRSIAQPFAENFDQFKKIVPDYQNITHVIAGKEQAVRFAANIRNWLGIKINQDETIINCTNKFAMKDYLSKFDIPVTNFIMGNKDLSDDKILKQLGLPIISKPVNSSGSRGVEFINTPDQLQKCSKENTLFESYIEGSEGSVESFICNGEIQFSNITEYIVPGLSHHLPATYPDKIQQEIKALNKNVIKFLGVQQGMTHLEFYITSTGVLFGEIALRPPGGFIMDLLEISYGVNFWDLYLAVELGEKPSFPTAPIETAGLCLVCPDEGRVSLIEGEDIIKGLPNLHKYKLKVKEGERVAHRVGTGQSSGHIILRSKEAACLKADLEMVKEKLSVKVV